MNQEITIAADLVNYLYLLLEHKAYKDYFEYTRIIDQNIFTGDLKKLHIQNWHNKLKAIPDGNSKHLIMEFVEQTTNSIRRKIKLVHLNSTNHFSELLIADKSVDKIYFLPEISEEILNRGKLKFPKIEIHDKDSFLKPDHTHRLKNCPTKIRLQKGCTYDLKKILNPFLKESKKIKILDPYLPNYNAKKNLDKIFYINPCAYFELQFYSKKDYAGNNQCKGKKYDDFIDSINTRISQGQKINITEIQRDIHYERYILTDDFEICVPGGLDFLDKDGLYVKDRAHLRIELLKEDD